MKLSAKERLILSLDFEDKDSALYLLESLKNELVYCKVGLQLFTKYGIALLHEIKKMGFRIFLDLKFHDIPNTVASAIKSLDSIEVDLLNIHATCGFDGLKLAKETLQNLHPASKLIAVTVLTSLNDDALQQMGIPVKSEALVLQLCKVSQNAGLDGVVCSAQEVQNIKNTLGKDFLAVCPGIRRATDDINDQKRIVSPMQAIKNGADWIVVGRPIIKASSPAEEVGLIINEIEKGMQDD
ncbi:MAG TPA: orotidine-5'-phosphate decarboxylase [Caldisericia bacterium]|jgi:orotidine-5'-phosphate decarboxylase|nr:orotidine-5'-phosphate decarboxylase [Caldisericia bacterium]